MLKITRMFGLLLLLLLLPACNPTNFFLAGNTYYNPTATPRSFTGAQAAEVLQTQLVGVKQLPVTVTAEGETALLVQYTGDVTSDLATSDEGQQLLLDISRSVAGLMQVNYYMPTQVTVSPTSGSAAQVSGEAIMAWYNSNISEAEFLESWTLPTTAE